MNSEKPNSLSKTDKHCINIIATSVIVILYEIIAFCFEYENFIRRLKKVFFEIDIPTHIYIPGVTVLAYPPFNQANIDFLPDRQILYKIYFK